MKSPRMPKTKRYAKRASRALKRIQREPIAIAVRSALATEIWFRSSADPARKIAMQNIIEEVLRWFLSRAEEKSVPYERINHSAPSLRFWLDLDLIARSRALARRDGVTKRQVIGTALIVYSREMIPTSMTALRRHMVRESQTIYRHCRGARLKSNRRKIRHP
jgi:hypothetical protein